MYSYWEKKYWKPESDVAIVGSGLVGLYIANFLIDRNPRLSITVLDRSDPPLGASTKNAGFACFGTAGEILSDLEHQSEEEVLEMIRMRWEGLQKMLQYSAPEAIDYQANGGTELFRSESDFKTVHSQLSYVNDLLKEATDGTATIDAVSNSAFKKLSSSNLYNTYEGQLNPVLLVSDLRNKAIKKGVRFQGNKQLNSFSKIGSKWQLNIEGGLGHYSQMLILATNAFTNDLSVDLDIVPYRNQVLVSQQFPDNPIEGCYHIDEGYIYFRNIDNRILIGGGRHFDKESEQTDVFGNNDRIIQKLLKHVKVDLGFSNFDIEYSWSGIIATGASKKPIIRELSNGLIIAARSGGMGVAISSQIATRVDEMIG